MEGNGTRGSRGNLMRLLGKILKELTEIKDLLKLISGKDPSTTFEKQNKDRFNNTHSQLRK